MHGAGEIEAHHRILACGELPLQLALTVWSVQKNKTQNTVSGCEVLLIMSKLTLMCEEGGVSISHV